MRKLISKNPVLRYKLGKLIIKAAEGTNFWMGRTGEWYSGNRQGNTISNPILITPEKTVRLKNGRTIAKVNGSWYWDNGEPVRKWVASTPTKTSTSVKGSNTSKNSLLKSTGSKNRSITKYTLPEGVTDIVATLRMLMANGWDGGTYKDDGKWGKETQEAWEAYLLRQTPTETVSTNVGLTTTPSDTGIKVSGNGFNFVLPKVSNNPVITLNSFEPGTFNTNVTYNRGNIRSNRGINYSNVDEYWDYLNNNLNTNDFKLWSNIMPNGLNREAFDLIMNNYRISGNLGRRDSGRLSNLLNDLNLIGIRGSDARNSFINTYNITSLPKEEILPANTRVFANRLYNSIKFKNGGLISNNPIERFKLGGVLKFQKAGNLPTAPKVEDRYNEGLRQSIITKGGRYGGKDKVEIKQVVGKKPSIFGSAPIIRQMVLHSTVSPDYNDTTYLEIPERKNPLVERKLRGIERHPSVFKTYYSNVYPFFGDILPDLGNGTKKEYETLKRRFNTAWNSTK